MTVEEENANSSEEEEEEDEPVPIRQQQVRMVVTDSSAGYGQESTADSPVAKTSPQAIVTTTSTTTKVSGNDDLDEAQEAAIEAARKRHQEAIEKARAEAVKMQEEARARAEAARQQQQQQILEQQKIAAEEQRQQQLKAQQEATKLQAEQRSAQLKAQQEAQKMAAQQQVQQQQKQQTKPTPQPPQQQKVLSQQQKPTPPTPTTPKQSVQTPTQPNKPAESKAPPPPQKASAQTQPPKSATPIQPKAVPQPKSSSIIQPKAIPASPTTKPIISNNPSQIRQPPPLAREPEPLEPPKQILAHSPFQPKNPKAENHSWPPPSEDEEEQTVEGGKRNKILDDNSWQFQKRIQLEYQPIQPTKIQPPELDFEGEIKKTIVPQPAGFSKVKWNEFTEEEQKEKQSVPRVKAQDWIPENDSEHPVLKTLYQPGKIAPNSQSGRLWPPPGYGEEEQIEIGHANKVKAVGDEDWKQGEQQEIQNGEDNNFIGNAPWSRQAAGGNVKNVQWPPPENQLEHGEFGRGKLNVQWPPSEQEEQEQKQVEILQTHLPTKPHQREWPPAHYVAAQGGEVEAQ